MRATGPDVRAIAARVFRARRPLCDRVVTAGRVVDAGGATIDEGLAIFFRAPRSYTGEDVLELHVHGSPAVASEVLAALLAAGAALAGPGEFTLRAFLAGKLDLSAAEAVADLIAAEHRSAARAAAARLGGGLGSEVERVRADNERTLLDLAAAIDFPDDVADPDRAIVTDRLVAARAALGALAQTWELGRLVREGASVAIVGAPNAGKSSLFNGLLRADRALVSPLAGTTRDTIEEALALDGVVARLIDTAGIRPVAQDAAAHAALEAAGVARAHAALDGARVALVVVDASAQASPEAAAIVAATRDRARVLFYNKADLGRGAYDARDGAEGAAILGSAFDSGAVAEATHGAGRHAPDRRKSRSGASVARERTSGRRGPRRAARARLRAGDAARRCAARFARRGPDDRGAVARGTDRTGRLRAARGRDLRPLLRRQVAAHGDVVP